MRDWRHNNNVVSILDLAALMMYIANLYFHAIYVFYVGDMGGFWMMLTLQLACVCRRSIT